MPLRQRKAFLGLDVSEDQEHGVRRRIVSLEEGLHVVERGGIEVSKIAVKIVRVVPVAVGHGRQVEPWKAAVGWLSTLTRTSSLTTSRWLRRFSSSTLRARMRSASSHNTRSSAFEGTASK